MPYINLIYHLNLSVLMKKYILRNGITLIHEKKSANSVAVEVMFKVGSNDETKNLPESRIFWSTCCLRAPKTAKTAGRLPMRLRNMAVISMPTQRGTGLHFSSR